MCVFVGKLLVEGLYVKQRIDTERTLDERCEHEEEGKVCIRFVEVGAILVRKIVTNIELLVGKVPVGGLIESD